MSDREWMMRASCRDHDPEVMFPNPRDRRGQLAAKRICIDCPVFDECDRYTRTTDPTHGVGAGEYRNQNRHFRVFNPSPDHGTPAGYQRHKRRGDRPCVPCVRAASLEKALNREKRGAR